VTAADGGRAGRGSAGPAVRRLGPLAVAPVGFGSLVLSPGSYGPVSDRDAQAALEAALSASGGAGRLLVDTSDSYGADYHGERLIGRWSAAHRDEVVVSTKFGFRPPAGTRRHAFEVGYAFGELAVNGSPALVRGYALGSLRRLGAERLDLFSPHFPDPVVPIGETVGAIAGLVQEGLVAEVGVANVSAAQLAEAAAVCTIAAVQVEWSMWHRPDPDLLAVADQYGIGVVAWGPLGSGFLAGGLPEPAPGDYRRNVPRLSGPNLAVNTDRYASVRALAADWGVPLPQLALAWLLRQHGSVVPIPGSRSPGHIAENAAAAAVTLEADRWAQLEAALDLFTPVGAPLLPSPSRGSAMVPGSRGLGQ
jgi:aryl-alcohol dehydrogenase-like predicted oxidoreductase